MGRRRWRRSQTVTAAKTIATRSASALCVWGGERSRTQTNRSCAASVTWPSTSGYLAMDSPFTDVPDDEDWCVCLHVHMGVR